MNYKEKYLIYKKKYLNLKKKQIGGAHFITIPNNGGAGPGTANQCIWISIRDYLNYNRGDNTTVTALKRLVGLGPETDLLEYDDNNPVLRQGLLELAEILGITLCFIYTNHDGSITPFCLNADGTLRPARIINPGTDNNVYIATFGWHFELIVQVQPHYQLDRDQNSTIINQKVYEPKIKIHNIYVAEKNISNEDPQLVQASINLAELMQNIEFFKIELERIILNIEDNNVSIENINSLDLDIETKSILKANYISMLKENVKIEIQLRKQLEQLKEEKLSLEAFLYN
jgi:hypothetical protein